MYTKEDLILHLKKLGVKSDDTIMVHTSLKSVGRIDAEDRTTAEVLIDALRECVSDGLLLIPAHTWATITESGQVFDVRESMPCIGALPTAAVKLANRAENHTTVLRSLHPTHSVVAFGKNAADYVRNDEAATTPTPWNGSFGKLYDFGAKILLIGVRQDRNTFFHAVDELLDIKNRLSMGELDIKIRGYDGQMSERRIHTHSGSPSKYFPNYEPYFDKVGAVEYGRLGDALVRVCDARKCTEAIKQLWANADCDLCGSEMRLD